MTSVVLDRFDGVVASLAIKAPVKAATTGSITLSGLQTIDGIAVVENDRVLVKDMGVSNGIYTVRSGAWGRAPDWDGTFDIVKGTLVSVAQGTLNGGVVFAVSTLDPIVIGTTSVTFGTTNFATVSSATEAAAGIAEIATQAETNTGADDTRIVTPLKLNTRTASETLTGIAEIATHAETNTGADDARIVTPLKLKTLIDARESAVMQFSTASGTVPDGATRFMGTAIVSASDTDAWIRVPYACTVKNLHAQVPGSATGTRSYTVMVNGVASSITAAASGTITQAQDTVNTATLAAGDRLSIRIVTSGGSDVVIHNATVKLISI